MKKFSCPRCGYSTDRIGDFNNHFERKNPCKPKIRDIPFESLYQFYYKDKIQGSLDDSTIIGVISNSDPSTSNSTPEEVSTDQESGNKYVCKFCGKGYAHRSSMYKHISIKHKNKDANSSEIETLKKEVEELKAQLLTERSPQINNTTNNNNTTYNQYFIVNNFGNEKIDYINEEYITQTLKQPKIGINKIIRQIHFNPGRPENHNVKITNKKLPYASVFKNNGWELDDKKKIINQMISRSYNIMDDVYHDKESLLEPSTRRQYQKFQNKFDENDPQLKKDLQKSTELQILNEQKVFVEST